MNWSDITLEKFMEIQAIKEIDPINVTAQIIKILYGINDPESLPYTEFLKYSEDLKFLGKEIKRVPLKDTYQINGTTYVLENNVMTFMTQQVVDWRNYSKEENNMHKFMSVVMVPEGHKYNDGYDMEKVQNDMLDLDMSTVISLMDFFQKCWVEFIKVSRDYLTSQLEKTEIPEEKRKEIEEKADLLQNMICSRLSSTTAKKQTKL